MKYINFKLESILINETPIEDFNLVGDFSKGSSFRSKVDRDILSSQGGQRKLLKMWLKTEYPFALWFVNSPKIKKYQELGEVSLEFIRNDVGLTPEEFEPKEDCINIIFGGNFGQEKVMGTPWIWAHRASHAMLRTHGGNGILDSRRTIFKIIKKLTQDINDIAVIYNLHPYEMGKNDNSKYTKQNSYILQILYQLGTFKSAREKNLSNAYEFIHECFAQYIIEGKIKFNKLTNELVYGLLPFGKKSIQKLSEKSFNQIKQEIDHVIEMLEESLVYYFDMVCHESINKIFLM